MKRSLARREARKAGLSVCATTGGRASPPLRRAIHIRVAGAATMRDVVFTGAPQPIRL